MCGICGCSDEAHAPSSEHAHGPAAASAHPHPHEHAPGLDPHPGVRDLEAHWIRLEHDVLHKNAHLAEHNRAWFHQRRVLALNLVSSPGSGKTTLLERIIVESGFEVRVVQGDQATDRDAERIRRAGARAVQINTGTGCHLDAAMVARAASDLDPPAGSILAIENVGNLVCPALFDLGEHVRIAVLSVPEGADKPLKYPYLFRSSHLVVINKVDLLAHVDFDMDDCLDAVRRVNPDARVLPLSARTGAGLAELHGCLRELSASASAQK